MAFFQINDIDPVTSNSGCTVGKTIDQLPVLNNPNGGVLIPVRYNGVTYHIPFSALNATNESCYTEITTYSALTATTVSSGLTPGCYYFILDADSKLYSGGTNIIIQAVTSTKLALQGHGIFYTPKYDQTTPGFGIWDQQSTYNVNDKVFWGGYVWENVNGNTGSNIDIYNLDSEWNLVQYNITDYNISVDIINYDYENDAIIYRKDKSNNEVSTSYDNIMTYFIEHPIKSFQWGNPYDNVLYVGIGNNHIINSLFECINFRGNLIFSNNLQNFSKIYNNNFDVSTYFTFNDLRNTSSIFGNILYNQSSFDNNSLDNGYINYNIIDQSNFSYNNFINSSALSYNGLTNSYFILNSLNNSAINGNDLTDSSIESNDLSLSSLIEDNMLNNYSSIQNNKMFNSNIFTNNLNNNSNILRNDLTESYIFNNSLNNSNIVTNVLSYSFFNFSPSGILSNKNIRKNNVRSSNIFSNISLATDIYGNFDKTISTNQSGIPRLSYINSSNTIFITNVNN